MQKGYRPDGWLGLILGTKFYYDFSGKYTFESRMNALLGAVRAVMKGDSVNGHIEPEVRHIIYINFFCPEQLLLRYLVT